MKELLQTYVGSIVELDISGKKTPVRGKLIETGNDLIVLYNGTEYLYVPTLHIQRMSRSESVEKDLGWTVPAESPFEPQNELSYRKTLMNAKGVFTELYITGQQSVHGYVTSIMNDYFVYYSPVFHAVFVSLRHLKYLIPYMPDATPYALNQERFPLQPVGVTLARTFDQQLKKLEGQFVVLDLGENPNKIGLLKTFDYPMLELVTSKGESMLFHAEHVKTVHMP
ncbi:DUF2642 domain-containing protein [Paenibacillus thermoaerophilus]|nr:DUF2642 domain-containing protein [Paenibacillus thermoaerophilus]TMV16209.1 DUF2642 domain-containing protein [Paenibacillus thermoaerophilus]